MAGEPDTASAELGLKAAEDRSCQLPTATLSRRRADLCGAGSELEMAHVS